MQRTIRRLALVAFCAAALAALGAAPAQAAITATTGTAGAITANSALLRGTVATGGAQTLWAFQWGTTMGYGQTTPIQTIPPGSGTVTVSSPISGLSPATTYHFRLVALTKAGSSYQVASLGKDASFKTKSLGKVILRSKHLKMKKKTAKISLKCASSQSCQGTLTLKSHGKKCLSKSFTIGAGQKKKVKAKVRKGCRMLLTSSKHQKIKGKLKAKTSTGQKGFSKRVTLKLV